MLPLTRLFHVLRHGPRPRKLQAWAGVILLAGASAWLIVVHLLEVAACFIVGLVGVLLVRRSLRESRPSS